MSKYEADPEDPMAKFSRAQPKVSGAKETKKEINSQQKLPKLDKFNPGEERPEQCEGEGEGGLEEGAGGAQRAQEEEVCFVSLCSTFEPCT